MSRELPTGIVAVKRRGALVGYRTFQWVKDPERPNGRIASKRWKADATLTEMGRWREQQRVDSRKPKPVADAVETLAGFSADAVPYLEAVRSMTSYKDRARDIGEWIAIFGETPSLEIKSSRIRAAREQWLTIGPKRVLVKVKGEKPRWVSTAAPLSASAVNHRLRALENFFTVMYPGKPNPVREVPEANEPEREPRGHSFALSLEILGFMPDRTAPIKGGAHEPGSLSRARFEAMLWTGLPAVQLGKLKPELIDWIAGTMLVPRREKGKKSRRARRRQERPRRLLPQAQEALKRLFALKGNRPFSSTSLGRSMHRAIRAANVVRAEKNLPLIPESVTVYEMTRHTFGTEALRASKNLKAVQDLLGLSDLHQTERYSLAAVDEQSVIAINQLAAHARNQATSRRLTAGKVSPHKWSGQLRTPRVTDRRTHG